MKREITIYRENFIQNDSNFNPASRIGSDDRNYDLFAKQINIRLNKPQVDRYTLKNGRHCNVVHSNKTIKFNFIKRNQSL